ncbi:outer membrane protein assembly factor BamD [Candidatus Tachikawaea gelatinosa]|nr:outer membrane protein assembly factor BamD [Candidatus Tachikawaea gelatinosa]
MIKFIKYFIISLLSITITNCVYSKEAITNKQLIVCLNKKKLHIKKINISELEQINQNYFHPCSDQIQISLINEYYKKKNFFKAQQLIKQFIQFHQGHKNIDYIFYMKGLINVSLDNNILHKLFFLKNFETDPKYAKRAVFYFHYLITNYPYSNYKPIAKNYLRLLEYRLARHDYAIINFYYKHKEYRSVINRVKEMIKKYPNIRLTTYAIKLMKKSYDKLEFNLEIKKH